MSESTGETVAKNASVLMVSQLLTWCLTLPLMVLMPRYLGAEGVGRYNLAFSLWAIASTFAAFGMDVLLIKEVARNPEKINSLLGTSLVVRTLLFVVSAVGMAFYALRVGYPIETLHVIAVVGVSSLVTQYSTTLDSVLRGLERMEFISIGSVVLKATLTAGGILLLVMGYDVVMVASVSVVANLVHFLLMLYFTGRIHPVRLYFDRKIAYWILKSSYSYLSVHIFTVVYIQIDIVIISLIVNEETIGWYATADQLFGTLLFIPTVLAAAFFPALSRLHTNESGAAGKLMSKGFDVLLLLSVPVGLGLVVVSGPLVLLLFGESFAPSGPVLAIFGIVLIFTYLNSLLGQYFISIDRQGLWTWIMAIATLITIPLDLTLVPWCVNAFGNGAIGGALAFVVTELGMLITGIICLPKGTFGWDKLASASRIVAAGALMAGAAWLTRGFFIAVPVIVGMLVYPVFIALFKALPAEDWASILRESQRILGRLRGRSPQPASP